MQTGKLIVIEGGDAAGKATQTALLTEHLKADGVSVETLDFPRYHDNTIGALIRECLDGKRGDFMNVDPRVTSVLYAADRFETMSTIEGWLHHGRVVILDRYTSANMLHQGAKIEDPELRRETLEWIYRVEHQIFGLAVPDALIYLSVPATVRAQLLQKQWVEQGRAVDVAEMDVSHQTKVDECANGIIEMCPHAGVIDCMEGGNLRSPESIHEEIYQYMRGILES